MLFLQQVYDLNASGHRPQSIGSGWAVALWIATSLPVRNFIPFRQARRKHLTIAGARVRDVHCEGDVRCDRV
jgi:hypothetical protein